MRAIAVAGLLFGTFAFTSPVLADGAVVGGSVFVLADADGYGPTVGTASETFTTSSNLTAGAANQGTGANVSAVTQTGAWVNRIGVGSEATKGFVIGSALSMFAVNQKVTGTPGSNAHVSYSFAVDGNFTPGDAAFYPPYAGRTQNLTFYLIAYPGLALNFSVQNDVYGDYLLFQSSSGVNTVTRTPGSPGYVSSGFPPLAFGSVCTISDARCSSGGSFADTVTIGFDVPVGQDYFVVGFLTSQTNGQTDFLHTAELKSIGLAPEFGLVSDDGGALVRLPNGSFQLAGVPEPSSWAMLIAGFGLTGAAMRRRHRNRAPMVARA